MDPSYVFPDFEIQRSTLSLASGQPAVQIAQANVSRIYLAFISRGNSFYMVWPFNDVTQNVGYAIQSNGVPLEFFFRLHGSLVGHEWYIDQTSVGLINVVEVIYRPKR